MQNKDPETFHFSPKSSSFASVTWNKVWLLPNWHCHTMSHTLSSGVTLGRTPRLCSCWGARLWNCALVGSCEFTKSVPYLQLRCWCWLASAVLWLVSTSSSSTLTTSVSMLRQTVVIWSRQKIHQQFLKIQFLKIQFLKPNKAKKGCQGPTKRRTQACGQGPWLQILSWHGGIWVLLHNNEGLERGTGAPLLCFPPSCIYLWVQAVRRAALMERSKWDWTTMWGTFSWLDSS